MHIEIQFTTGRIPRLPPEHPLDDACGALAEFHGIIRGSENGESITGLRYEMYEAMAEKEIRRLLTVLHNTFPCEAATVIHRYGLVPVGETAIYVGIQARHRQEAFGMLAAFMDRLKQDVPIWKTEVVKC